MAMQSGTGSWREAQVAAYIGHASEDCCLCACGYHRPVGEQADHHHAAGYLDHSPSRGMPVEVAQQRVQRATDERERPSHDKVFRRERRVGV